jgi:hypothetical protein
MLLYTANPQIRRLYALRPLIIVLPRPILAIGPKWHQHAEINFQWHTLVVSVG